MVKKGNRDRIVDVRNAISVTTPKYCDKTIKIAFLKCVSHYALHGDKSQFDLLFKELPKGTWSERLKTFYEFVIAIPKSDMRSRFSEVRECLDKIIKTPGYKSSSKLTISNREGFSYKTINNEIISAIQHSEIHGDTSKLKHVLMKIPLPSRIKVIKKITEKSSYVFNINGYIYKSGCRFVDSEFHIRMAKNDGRIGISKGKLNEGFIFDNFNFIS